MYCLNAHALPHPHPQLSTPNQLCTHNQLRNAIQQKP
jgi:hypothetical protein